ncbi:MAG: hypothetical protein HS122_04260 [Opitutaceae bacterium]|nr:hypothetical protein [Opitutaceae bacterium]
MKSFHLRLLLAPMLLVLFAAGCSTPQSRIDKNPAAFSRLTPQQQDLIKKGQVALGFDKEAVQLALGEPDRLITRTDASGTKEIWSYTTYEGMDGAFLYRGWYHRYYCYADPMYPYYLNFPSRRTRERFRVVFSDNKVIEIQQEH